MKQLRPEYEKIRADTVHNCIAHGSEIELVRIAVEACQELAARPPKELTDAEIEMAYLCGQGGCIPLGVRARIREVIAAHIAKQREPEVVKVKCRFWHYTDSRSGLLYCNTERAYKLDADYPASGGEGSEWVGEVFEREVTL